MKFFKKIKTLLLCVFLLLIIYAVDWGFLKGEISNYPLSCSQDLVDYSCQERYFTLNYFVYKPSQSKQEVVSWMPGFSGIDRYKNCIVINRRNWECTYDDGSGKFGFHGGSYWQVNLQDNSLCKTGSQESFCNIIYVLRPVYLYYEWFH